MPPASPVPPLPADCRVETLAAEVASLKARVLFWRGLYTGLVEAIMVDSKDRPTMRLPAIEAQLMKNMAEVVEASRVLGAP